MSRPITLTEEVVSQLLSKIKAELSSTKLFDSKLNIDYQVNSNNNRATINFVPSAFMKMLALVNNFDSEVAWHGIVERTVVEDKPVYTIKDIIVYPQEVTGSTVNTDQEGYEKFLMSLDDELFNNLKMQGHSHVNMGTTPSSVDLSHQERIVEQLEDNMYYIFMIWNKRMDYNIKVFDMITNTLYVNEDLDIKVGDVDLDCKAFVDNAKSLVKSKSYYAYPQYTKNFYQKEAEKKAKESKEKPAGKKEKNKSKNYFASKSRDYDDLPWD